MTLRKEDNSILLSLVGALPVKIEDTIDTSSLNASPPTSLLLMGAVHPLGTIRAQDRDSCMTFCLHRGKYKNDHRSLVCQIESSFRPFLSYLPTVPSPPCPDLPTAINQSQTMSEGAQQRSTGQPAPASEPIVNEGEEYNPDGEVDVSKSEPVGEVGQRTFPLFLSFETPGR